MMLQSKPDRYTVGYMSPELQYVQCEVYIKHARGVLLALRKTPCKDVY